MNNNVNKITKEKIDNTEGLKNLGIRIKHYNNQQRANSRFTIGYRFIGYSVVEIATAICHKGDTFTKKVGTKKVIENFQAGNTILVPVNVFNTMDQVFYHVY